MNQSPYKTLDVPVTASPKMIRAAHWRMAMKYHPDRLQASIQGQEFAARRMAEINAARDALLTKNGKLTPLAKQLRRQHARGAGATVHHERHTFYQGGRAVGSVDVIYAEATNAAMQELLEQIEHGEQIDLGAIIGAGVRASVPKGRRRR